MNVVAASHCEVFEGLFRSKLANWRAIEADWPENLTFPVSRKWLSVEWHSVVLDLFTEPLNKTGADFGGLCARASGITLEIRNLRVENRWQK